MTIPELRAALHGLGFVSAYDEFEDGEARIIVAKRAETPGHRLYGEPAEWSLPYDGEAGSVNVDAPAPQIDISPARITFSVTCGVPTSPGAYVKELETLEAVLEEVIHYFHDPDSRMRLEATFQPGPGRPEGTGHER